MLPVEEADAAGGGVLVRGLRFFRIPHALHNDRPSTPVRHCDVLVEPQAEHRRCAAETEDTKRPREPRERVVNGGTSVGDGGALGGEGRGMATVGGTG